MDDLNGRSLRRHLPPLLLRLLGRPVVVEGDGGLVLPWVDEKLRMDEEQLKRKKILRFIRGFLLYGWVV